MIIYKTTNLINCKIYIGQDSKNNLKYLGSGVYLVKSIKKYGKENFKKEILRYCKTQKELNLWEKIYIKKFNSTNPAIGYNILTASMFYCNPMKIVECVEKMKKSRKNYRPTELTKQRQSISQRKKDKDKPETRLKKSIARKKYLLQETTHKKIERGRNISLSKLGHVTSEESRVKMSLSHMGKIPWNKGLKLKKSI